jgi:exodeoxyribonuclease VII large subunit
MSNVPVQTVSQLTREIKDLVEGNLPFVWVQGEVSNCTRAGSGHVYLTLKDEAAQMRAVIWRRTASRLRFDLHDGLEVVAAGPIEVYQARGTYQLVVEQLIPQGVGSLELAFRQMQEKLAAEGLFDPAVKRPLPRFPRRIALVTSPTGAAVRDLLQVMTRRWQAADVVIVPVPVQGEGAAQQIAAGLKLAPRIPDVDVVITGRGGGSLEDLWAFNEEVVARAIRGCPVPVISAVGHEIDVSIADLAADRRALTPSEAGELVVPDRAAILGQLHHCRDRLINGLKERAGRTRAQLDAVAARRVLTRPAQRLHDLTARVDELGARVERAMQRRLQMAQRDVAGLSASLEALSPLKVLTRGYSITTHTQTGEVIRHVNEVQVGDSVTSHLRDGRVIGSVEKIEPASGPFDSTASDTPVAPSD